MEKVSVWYLTDNEQSKKLIEALEGIGLPVTVIKGIDLGGANVIDDEINIFIFDFNTIGIKTIIKAIEKAESVRSCVKFIALRAKDFKQLTSLSFNQLHIEFLSRPLRKRELLLLIEKTIVVERYREIMKFVSKEAESRIEAFEGLMDINRKNVFESEKEKNVFENILNFEKNLLKKQVHLNEAIRGFTILRKSELFEMRNRIKAEEMLSDLRRKELMDAKNVIEAQESLIQFSARQLDEKQRMLSATESLAEFSRTEKIALHDELNRERELNKSLSEEVERLLKELDTLKKRLNEG